MTRMARFTVPLGCLMALLSGCQAADSPTSPASTPRLSAPPAMSADIVASGQRSDTVLTLKRLQALSKNYTVSASIGVLGGSLSIPQAGATIYFPPGALSAPTTITMKAKAGYDVAYEFAPHGITFGVPAILRQDLSNTWAAAFPALAKHLGTGYYDNDNLDDDYVDPWHLFATAKEVHAATVSTNQVIVTIPHFSGWMVCTGRSLDYDF